MQKMTRFFFGTLRDEGVKAHLLGTFDKRGVLTVARLADHSCEWHKQPGETAEGFENRVTGDLLNLMGVVSHSSSDSEHAPQAAE